MQPLSLDWHLLWLIAERLGLAYILSFPTAWWSEKEGHAVGIRTFPIVAMASCGYMLVMQNIAGEGDISRVLQGLLTGIGFVGGGAIVKEGANVKGTATAASIWNTGAIGSAVALGRLEIAIILAVLNLLTLEALVPIKKRLDEEAETRRGNE